MDFACMTDAQLREELKRRRLSAGVVTPSTRAVYVKKLQDYERANAVAGVKDYDGPEPMDWDGPGEAVDDDVGDVEQSHVARSPSTSPPRDVKSEEKKKWTVSDIERMSDAELRKELVARGQSVGPVTSSTRAVYERKLASLTGAGGKR